MRLHRLNAGNYVSNLSESVGTWVVYRYENEVGRFDGWMVCEYVATEWGSDLVSREWTGTLAEARALIAEYAGGYTAEGR